MLWVSFEGMNVVGFVPKAQNSLIFLGQVSKKSGIQEKWMIPIIIDVLLLNRHAGIMVIEEYGIARLQYWNILTMNTGGVEEKS